MIDIQFSTLDAFIRSKLERAQDYEKVMGLCLGIAVARITAIPSSEVENIEQHWQQQVCYEAKKVICFFNEQLVVNVDAVMDTARQFYLARYSAAHPPVQITPYFRDGEVGTFMEGYLGVSQHICADARSWLNKYPQAYTTICNRMVILLQEKLKVS
jgi:hypothetical protein